MPPFDVNEDGSAKDPGAYRAAIMNDAQKLKAIQARHVAACSLHATSRTARGGAVPGAARRFGVEGGVEEASGHVALTRRPRRTPSCRTPSWAMT